MNEWDASSNRENISHTSTVPTGTGAAKRPCRRSQTVQMTTSANHPSSKCPPPAATADALALASRIK